MNKGKFFKSSATQLESKDSRVVSQKETDC